MWFEPDRHAVSEGTFVAPSGMEVGVMVRFVSHEVVPWGSQFHCGKQGWFCGYVSLRDLDFDLIRPRLAFDDGRPLVPVPGGVTYYNKAPPFEGESPGYAVIGWDYNHGEPEEAGVTLADVCADA